KFADSGGAERAGLCGKGRGRVRARAVTGKVPQPGARGGFRAGSGGLEVCLLEIRFREFPVYEVLDKGLEVVRPPVLVVEIIGVFPDIGGEKGDVLLLRDRRLGVRRAIDLELAVGAQHEPAIARAEL